MKTRLGSVPYLNARPLFVPLWQSGSPELTLIFDVPDKLAQGLSEGLLNGALCPALHAVTGDYEILPDWGIVSRGAVGSVHLYSAREPRDWRTIARDPVSVSSAGLVEVLCRQHFVNQAVLVSEAKEVTDAYFLIGDADLTHVPVEGVRSWDLGACWMELTGLPFLYAAWIVRPDLSASMRELLQQCYRSPDHPDIAADLDEEASRLGISRERIDHYLSREIHYELDEEVFAGFAEYLRRLNKVRSLERTTFRVAPR